MIEHCSETDLRHVAPLLRGLNALHADRVPWRFHVDADDGALCGFLRREMDEGARVLVYKAESVVRGYLLWKPRDIAASAVERPRLLAVLDHICVAPSWRRRGIARRLVARFEADIAAEGCDGWITYVHGFNAASRALMRRAGADVSVEILEKRLTP